MKFNTIFIALMVTVSFSLQAVCPQYLLYKAQVIHLSGQIEITEALLKSINEELPNVTPEKIKHLGYLNQQKSAAEQRLRFDRILLAHAQSRLAKCIAQ